MLKKLVLAVVFSAAGVGIASATPITGSFSLASFSGSYVGGTAQTATGLDFGAAFAGSGNGYGTNGTALVGNATGSFAGLNGTFASIADISLGTTANPYTSNPFVSFGSSSLVTLNFTDASLTRSGLGTSVTVSGLATFADGVDADTSTGRFTLSASSQDGMSSSVNFTFTGNASVTDVPEPATLALLWAPLVAAGLVKRRRQRAATAA